eukprot:scaffold39860_cov57-Attheya_sp.AAC.8
MILPLSATSGSHRALTTSKLLAMREDPSSRCRLGAVADAPSSSSSSLDVSSDAYPCNIIPSASSIKGCACTHRPKFCNTNPYKKVDAGESS